MRVSAVEMEKLLTRRKWPDNRWVNGPWYRVKQYGSGVTHSEAVGRRKTRWLPCLRRALEAEFKRQQAVRLSRRGGGRI